MSAKAIATTFIPLIVVAAIFGTYLILTPVSTTIHSTTTTAPIYSMPPPRTMTAGADEWQFTVTETQAEVSIGVVANLTYVGNTNATYTFGAPLVLNQIEAENGTIVWSEVTTELLRLEVVTPGQMFSDSAEVPTSQLQLGQTYTLLVYPQVSGNGLSYRELEVSFGFSPLAVVSNSTQP